MTEMNTSSWKEFRLDELFDIETTWVYGKNKKYKTKTINKTNKSIAVISGITSNNGINYYTEDNLKNEEIFSDCLTITTRGEYCGTVFYHEYPFALANNILAMPMPNLSRREKLFIATSIQALPFGGYGNYPTKDKLKECIIKLPVTSSGEIDWQYMQERIAELEQERIAELEHYLVASGLNDYELTEEDKSILATELFNGDDATELPSENSCRKEARKFKISDVFNLCKGKRLIKSEHIYGNTPFIGSTDSNNGVTGYIGQEPIFSGNAITISYNGSVGQVFYQENDFWASDDINVLYLKNHVLNALLYGYLSGALKKAGSKFSYSYKWNLKRMKKTLITLPIQTDTDHNPIIDPENTYHPEGYIPDWSFMENYIRAVEKVVIKDVVDWKDEEIKKTKELVS